MFQVLPPQLATYYAPLLATAPVACVEIVTHLIKGKCLLATKALQKGDLVLQESALCCTLNMDSRERNNKEVQSTCSGCLAEVLSSSRVESGDDIFCTKGCVDSGRCGFHHAIMSRVDRSFYCTNRWIVAGIDYTDTILMAAKILTGCIERSRREKISLAECWMPWSLFVMEPLNRFDFAYLVNKVEHDDTWGQVDTDYRRKQLRKMYRTFRSKPSDRDPGVIQANAKSTWTKDSMLASVSALLQAAISQPNPEESEFLSPSRLSLTMGLVLQNSQTRYPSDKSLQGQAIYAIGSCFNHSCDPNVKVAHCPHHRDERMHAIALRDIAVGEECCISYMDENRLYEERQWYLYEHYLFDCTCPKCISEGPEMKSIAGTIVQ